MNDTSHHIPDYVKTWCTGPNTLRLPYDHVMRLLPNIQQDGNSDRRAWELIHVLNGIGMDGRPADMGLNMMQYAMQLTGQESNNDCSVGYIEAYERDLQVSIGWMVMRLFSWYLHKFEQLGYAQQLESRSSELRRSNRRFPSTLSHCIHSPG